MISGRKGKGAGSKHEMEIKRIKKCGKTTFCPFFRLFLGIISGFSPLVITGSSSPDIYLSFEKKQGQYRLFRPGKKILDLSGTGKLVRLQPEQVLLTI